MREILNKLNIAFLSTDEHLLMYSSPFSDQSHDHLVVNTETNTWWDETLKRGGRPIDIVVEFLRTSGQRHTAVDALRWIRTEVGYRTLELPADMKHHYSEDKKYLLKEVSYISSGFLIAYLEDVRAIPVRTAMPLIKEVTVLNQKTGKEFKALGLENEDGGFAIRNPFMKGHAKPDNITFLRGKVPKPETVHIFKDMFDYLSAVEHNRGNHFHGDTIVLNSLANIPKSSAYIRNYGYRKCYTWFDNTVEGNRLTAIFHRFLKTEPDLTHYKMNKLYEGYKDVNAWLAGRSSLGKGE